MEGVAAIPSKDVIPDNIMEISDEKTITFFNRLIQHPYITMKNAGEVNGIYIEYKADNPGNKDIHAHVFIDNKEKSSNFGKLTIHLSGRCKDEKYSPGDGYGKCPKQVGCHFQLKGKNLEFPWPGNNLTARTSTRTRSNNRNAQLLNEWVKNNENANEKLIHIFENMLRVCDKYCDTTDCDGSLINTKKPSKKPPIKVTSSSIKKIRKQKQKPSKLKLKLIPEEPTTDRFSADRERAKKQEISRKKEDKIQLDRDRAKQLQRERRSSSIQPMKTDEDEPTTPSSQTPQLNPNASVFFMPTKGGRKLSKKTKKLKKCGGKSSKKLKKTRKKSRKKTKSKHKK